MRKHLILILVVLMACIIFTACGKATSKIAATATPTVPSTAGTGGVKAPDQITDVNPADYSFEVQYEDIDGGIAPDSIRLSFQQTGQYSTDDIPIPEGYQRLIPASPDEEWLYPTGLEQIDGEWQVTVPVVIIAVEKVSG